MRRDGGRCEEDDDHAEIFRMRYSETPLAITRTFKNLLASNWRPVILSTIAASSERVVMGIQSVVAADGCGGSEAP